jgi:hypothetical protein
MTDILNEKRKNLSNSSLDIEGLESLRMKLKLGEYDGVDIMEAWIAIDELIKRRVYAAESDLTCAEGD